MIYNLFKVYCKACYKLYYMCFIFYYKVKSMGNYLFFIFYI